MGGSVRRASSLALGRPSATKEGLFASPWATGTRACSAPDLGGLLVMVIRRVLGGFLTLAVLVCLAAPGAGKDEPKKGAEQPPADKATLKWKFEKNKPFYQTMTTVTDQSMNVMNNEVKQKQTQT